MVEDIEAPIFVAGHRGMVGGAIVRALRARGYRRIVTRTRAELDLRSPEDVRDLLQREKVAQIYLAGAKVGGIHANNTYPADFIRENLQIEVSVIHAAHMAEVDRLLCLGSSCIYPRDAAQPMPEEALLTGPLEPTNESYAIAKIAGIKLCESYNRQHGRDYRSVMPTNLYGPHDNFHPENSHVIPGLIRRFHEAVQSRDDEVVVWGSGKPRREFLHVDDMADASVHAMELPRSSYWSEAEENRSHLNIGVGTDCSIAELAKKIARIMGFEGRIRFDTRMPDGSPRKLLDVSRMERLGWSASIGLEEGLRETCQWFVENAESERE